MKIAFRVVHYKTGRYGVKREGSMGRLSKGEAEQLAQSLNEAVTRFRLSRKARRQA
jgi:hypothetical protein